MKRKYIKSKLGKNKNERYARSLLYSYASPSMIKQLKMNHFSSRGGK